MLMFPQDIIGLTQSDTHDLNANCPSGEERSGTGNSDYLKRSNDREKSASAKTTTADVTGRAPAITAI